MKPFLQTEQLAALLIAVLPLYSHPQSKPAVPASNALRQAVHLPWQAPARQGTADAYFLNLEEGAKIETPFRLDFGLAGAWGLAPITSPSAGKSGHHHLFVNRDLPLDFKKALPFNDQ